MKRIFVCLTTLALMFLCGTTAFATNATDVAVTGETLDTVLLMLQRNMQDNGIYILDLSDAETLHTFLRNKEIPDYYLGYEVPLVEEYSLKVNRDRMLTLYDGQVSIPIIGCNADTFTGWRLSFWTSIYAEAGSNGTYLIGNNLVAKMKYGEEIFMHYIPMKNASVLCSKDTGVYLYNEFTLIWLSNTGEIKEIATDFAYDLEYPFMEYFNSVYYINVNRELVHYNLLSEEEEVIAGDVREVYKFVHEEYKTYDGKLHKIPFYIDYNGQVVKQ